MGTPSTLAPSVSVPWGRPVVGISGGATGGPCGGVLQAAAALSGAATTVAAAAVRPRNVRRVTVYFASQNPTQVNGQGPDNGSQYRSIIFYQNDEQKQIILKKKEAIAKKLNAKIAAEVYPFQKFWKAEDYHQNYEKLHPNNSYIRNVSIPRLNKFKTNFPKELLKGSH
jgi:hypothetical protein